VRKKFILGFLYKENIYLSTYSERQTDEYCITTGCSNQICQSKNEGELMTTCEFKECFGAKTFKVTCKCIDNKCQ